MYSGWVHPGGRGPDHRSGSRIRSSNGHGGFPVRLLHACCLVTIVGLVFPARAAEPDADLFVQLGSDYVDGARPLLERYCIDCHAMPVPQGDLDLERLATLADVRQSTDVWLKVAEMLDDGQMPPSDSDQPTAGEKKRLRDWIGRYLDAEARAAAGDPGHVPLRRLTKAEYRYSIRDLTGVDLDPAREFPDDGAAGEGFTNASAALVMSPALLAKYLDAGKQVARHAVLLPDGFRFSPATTRRDWTEEILADIRAIYHRYADAEGGTQVNLQGIRFDTNRGGRLPIERYLVALLASRDSLADGKTTLEAIAAEQALSAKYLASLQQILTSEESSPVLDPIRGRWRTATMQELPAIVDSIAAWQAALSRFQNVGHMRPWVVPVDPITTRQELRLKLPDNAGSAETIVLRLTAADAGDGPAGDFVVWERPRIVAAGRPDLLLRDVRRIVDRLNERRQRIFDGTAAALAAADEADRSGGAFNAADLAQRHGVKPDILAAWLECLGIGPDPAAGLDRFTDKIEAAAGYEFINGWGTSKTPNLLANSSSDQNVRIPGKMRPGGVVVHPSPTLSVGVGWQSPLEGDVRIAGSVTHAHSECGNGVTWSLVLRRGGTRRQLAAGVSAGANAVAVGPIESLAVRPGDLVSLLIGPRDGNHVCDLTDVELTITSRDDNQQEWILTKDVSPDVTAGNPHADRYGNDGVWHFYTEPVTAGDNRLLFPEGSLLARWQAADSTEVRQQLATAIQKMLGEGPPEDDQHPDSVLYRKLSSLGGPLLEVRSISAFWGRSSGEATARDRESDWGLDPAAFGRHPDGSKIESASLCVQAPSVMEVRLPADLVAGAEFIVTGVLHEPSGGEGTVQLQAVIGDAKPIVGLQPDLPVLVSEGSQAQRRIEESFAEFRRWFPAALCYTKIVPVDEVVTLTLFHREDEPLSRLMLDEAEAAALDRLWDELHFVSQDAFAQVDAFVQLMEYATQDGDPSQFEPFRKPINERAEAFRTALLEAESKHLDELFEYAGRVYRRPLLTEESQELKNLYRTLRDEDLSHEEAFRLTLARLFVSPNFIYRLETAPAGSEPGPVTDWELASRLSYFLWSSVPDKRLREAAAAGRLHDPDQIAAQARRMLADDRVRRLATEFACQWLQIYEFDTLDEKSERHFPEFAAIRDDMYEEPIRFFTDFAQRDGSLLELIDADYVFVNGPLAEHYGIPGVTGPEWRRVEDVRQFGRGGLLAFGATLAKQSGASRTSPTLRGTWISDVLLGEKLPPPPKGVPELPDDVSNDELTVRELVELHSSDPACAGCHVRVDPFGFALERFDAIGRFRQKDAAGRPLETQTTLRDGTQLDGLDGLREHLLNDRRDAVLKQFCRKLLGYALGRGVQLSDEPLLEEMQQRLKQNDYRFSIAVDAIVRSPQFREIRGRDTLAAGDPG